MPALLVKRDIRTKHYHVVQSENRPAHILMRDVDNAEAILCSTGGVWIPAYLRGLLAERIGQDITPLVLYQDKTQ